MVRGSVDPTTAPNANGIYALGNSIGSGTVVHQGTDTALTNTNLSPGSYYYRIYTYDKAYNYSPALSTNVTLLNTAMQNPPALNSASSATVDADFAISFVADSAWENAITGITVDASPLPSAAFAVSSGQITLKPSQSTLLQAVGSKTIAISATGYNGASVTQAIGVGVAAKLAVTTQPTAPVRNTATLATQPVVAIQDQYGNLTASTNNVTVSASGASGWSLGGTLTVKAVSGTATFAALNASSALPVTGAALAFASTGLTGAVSSAVDLPAQTEVSLSAVGVAVLQDFDSLATNGTSSTLPAGWYTSEVGANGNASYTAGTGSSSTADIYSFGASNSVNRALGGVSSGNLALSWGAKFKNQTSATITALKISYTGETWRIANINRSDSITFAYSSDAISLGSGTWTDVGQLGYSNPDQPANANGSLLHSQSVTAIITGLALSADTSFWIRWTDNDASGSEDGIGIDDVSVAAVSAPSAPTIESIVPADGGLTINFTAPTSDGGDAVSGYQYSTDSGASWVTPGSPVTASPFVISGLTNGQSYGVAIRAVNGVGSGAASSTVSGTPQAPAPSNVSFAGWRGSNAPSAELLTQYAFGAGTPGGAVNRSNLPVGGVSDGNLTMTYHVRAEATNPNLVTPQVHTNLVEPNAWAAVDSNNITTLGTNTVDGVQVIQKRVSVPVEGSRKFLRLIIAE